MIDYQRISEAISHYRFYGFRFIDVPWTVRSETHAITCPPGKRAVTSDVGLLVASGEQSFLEMMQGCQLEPGKWSCATPCFRNEEYDELHQPYFMKVELIDTEHTTDDRLFEMIDSAYDFFNKYVPADVVKLVDPTTTTGYSYDIQTPSGIELGSYGIRRWRDLTWIYGTGLAEPRLSIAMKKESESGQTK